MSSAATIRLQIESALARKIPLALTPAPKVIRPVAATGIETLDELLEGGLPLGAITEMVGPECSGRTSLALSFVSRMTQTGKVCAWVDVSNTLHPESAAAVGIDLSRMLWVRCGIPATNTQQAPSNGFALPEKYLIPAPIKKGLHGGGFGEDLGALLGLVVAFLGIYFGHRFQNVYFDGAASVARSTEKIGPEEAFSRAPSAADLHQVLAVDGQRSAYLLMRNRVQRMPRCRDLRSRLVLRW